jgi:chromosome segregation ATPase
MPLLLVSMLAGTFLVFLLACLQARLAEAEDGSHAAAAAGGQGPSSGSRLNKYDEAVAAMHQQLPGRFYGRLCNTAYVSDASAEAAVAAALAETLNLGSTLITADREAAAVVCRHFQQQRVGRVACRILQELPPSADPAAHARQGPHQPPGQPQVQPLLSCVQPSSSCPEVRRLLQELLGRWTLVEDRSTAQQLLRGPTASRGRYGNLVTRAGEVFKADGEVVAGASSAAARGGGSSGCYALTGAVQPLSVAGAEPPQLNSDTGAMNVPTAQQQQAAASKAQLEENAAKVASQLSAAEADLQAAAQQHAELKQQLAAANSKLSKVTRSLAAATGQGPHQGEPCAAQPAVAAKAADLQQQLHQAWQRCDAAAGEAEGHQAAAAAADQQAAQLRRQLQDLHPDSAFAEGRAGSHGSSTAAGELAAAQAAYQKLQQQVSAAKQQQRRAASRVAALTKELSKLEEDPAEQRLTKLQVRA